MVTVAQAVDMFRVLYYTTPETQIEKRKCLMRAWEAGSEWLALCAKSKRLEPLDGSDVDGIGDSNAF